MKESCSVVKAKTENGAEYFQVLSPDGKPLPNQTKIVIEQEHAGIATVTVTIVIDMLAISNGNKLLGKETE
jgi:hypothetical protein